DKLVTGVQTCALPICLAPAQAVQVGLLEADVLEPLAGEVRLDLLDRLHAYSSAVGAGTVVGATGWWSRPGPPAAAAPRARPAGQIGRASCRERVEIAV